MNSTTFDTLSSSQRLLQKGFTQEQAEAMAEELRLAHDFDAEHFTKKSESILFKSEMRSDIALLEQRLIIKLGTMMIALAAFLSAIKFFG